MQSGLARTRAQSELLKKVAGSSVDAALVRDPVVTRGARAYTTVLAPRQNGSSRNKCPGAAEANHAGAKGTIDDFLVSAP